jgi:biotin operon repressor
VSKKNRNEGSFIQVEYDVLDLISYNGVAIDGCMKLILSMARSYQRSGNVYYESNPTLQRRLGLGEVAVSSRIKKLEASGLMRVERISGVGNKYYPLPFDLALAVFIPEKGATRDILRKQSVEQPEPTVQPVEHEPAAEPQEFNQPTEQGPADEYANDSPVQNDGYQDSVGQDQVANDCHVVGNPVVTASDIDTAFTSVFAVVPVIEDAFAVAEKVAVGIPEAQPVEPATSETWLDAPFTPHGELIPEAVQYCFEQGVTDPEEQKDFVRKLVDPDYVREKPIHNPTPAADPEWEDLPF